MVSTVSRNFNLQDSERSSQSKKGRREVGANFGWESLPNSIGTCKWASSDTASHFLSPTEAGKDSKGMPVDPS